MKIKAQSTIEYTVLLATIAVALVCMQVYSKRAIQSRLRSYAQILTPEYSASYNKVQFNPQAVLERGSSRKYNFAEGGELGDDYGYSRRNSSSFTYITTETKETSQSQDKKVTATAETQKVTYRQEQTPVSAR